MPFKVTQRVTALSRCSSHLSKNGIDQTAQSLMQKAQILSRFGSAVRAKRTELGLSQEELAGRAGLHRTYISDIERGARNISLESIEKLAQALETGVSHLFLPGSESAAIAGALRQAGVPGELVDILLVEDDPRDVELTLEAFAKAHITNSIQVARDGEEALDYLFCTGAYSQRQMSARPQVILLDLRLPKISGLEVLRQLRDDARTRTIPVVVLTESQRSRDMMECRQLGVESYIVKPVDFHGFSQVLPQLRFGWGLLKRAARAAP